MPVVPVPMVGPNQQLMPGKSLMLLRLGEHCLLGASAEPDTGWGCGMAEQPPNIRARMGVSSPILLDAAGPLRVEGWPRARVPLAAADVAVPVLAQR